MRKYQRIRNLREDKDMNQTQMAEKLNINQRTYSRYENADSLKTLIEPATKVYTMTELASMCRKAGIPAGEVNTQDRLLRSSYLEDQDLLMVVHDKKFGDCKTLGDPVKFDKFEIPKHRRGAQAGEDTADVLKELLGMSEDEIKGLYSYEGAVSV